MSDTKNWTIRNVPTETIDKIKEQAEKHRRSFNNEIIMILEDAVSKEENNGK